MKRFNRIVVGCFTALALMFGFSGLAMADYPDKPLRIIVPTSPGGSIDRMARSVERFLPEIIDVRVIVENRKGAGGTIAIKHFLRQKADGYTLLVAPQPSLSLIMKMAPGLVEFDQLSVINVNWIDPSLIVVRKDIGWSSFDDMITAIKNKPNHYKLGLAGKFAAPTFAMGILLGKMGIKVKKIPYTGGGDSRLALRGGHIDILAAGADGSLTIADVSKPVAVFWSDPIKQWPGAARINDELKKHNTAVPNMASIRFFAVHSDVKNNYPQRYQTLVSAFQKLVTSHEGFRKFCEESEIGHEWHGPKKSIELVMESHQAMSEIKMPKRKKKK
jgi:putative tricarboxylic transport membrane protein